MGALTSLIRFGPLSKVLTGFQKKKNQETSILALVVAAHEVLFGKPLRGKNRLAALLAALKYLKPDGSLRDKPLELRVYVTMAPDGSISSNVDSLVEDAVEEGLVSVESEKCIEGCDEPGRIYIYTASKKALRLAQEHEASFEEIRGIVARFGHMKPSELIEYIAEKTGLRKVLAHHGFLEL